MGKAVIGMTTGLDHSQPRRYIGGRGACYRQDALTDGRQR